MEHTKAPWRAGPVADTIIADEGPNNMSAEARAHYGGYLVAESVDAADREFIVRACNSHDQLVSALTACLKRLVADCADKSCVEIMEARAALTAAGVA